MVTVAMAGVVMPPVDLVQMKLQESNKDPINNNTVYLSATSGTLTDRWRVIPHPGTLTCYNCCSNQFKSIVAAVGGCITGSGSHLIHHTIVRVSQIRTSHSN